MEQKTFELKRHLADCIIMCNHCFKSCLAEEDVKMMVRCIKLDKECGEICGVTLSLVASHSEFREDFVRLCAKACDICAAECRRHDYDHCRKCAEACEVCAEACRAYLK